MLHISRGAHYLFSLWSTGHIRSKRWPSVQAPFWQCKNEHMANVIICIEGHGRVWTIIWSFGSSFPGGFYVDWKHCKPLFPLEKTTRIISHKLQVHLPDDYEALLRIADSLPEHVMSPVMPFVSLVVNINVRTEAHRDKWDKTLCLVLAVGDFSGGGLVLEEQGLILELQSGDFAVFGLVKQPTSIWIILAGGWCLSCKQMLNLINDVRNTMAGAIATFSFEALPMYACILIALF